MFKPAAWLSAGPSMFYVPERPEDGHVAGSHISVYDNSHL